MSTPYAPRPLPLTDADREAWDAYQRANRAAAREYAAYVAPTPSVRVRPSESRCQCGKKTRARTGMCRGCARVEREAGA